MNALEKNQTLGDCWQGTR